MGICWTSNRQLTEDVKFENQLCEVETAAWKSLKNVTTNFWVNHKAENYRVMVVDLVQFYKAMGYNVFIGAHS